MKPKETTKEYTPPPPTLFVSDDYVGEIFGKSLPKMGQTVNCKMKVVGIAEKDDSDGKKSRTVDLQLVSMKEPVEFEDDMEEKEEEEDAE